MAAVCDEDDGPSSTPPCLLAFLASSSSKAGTRTLTTALRSDRSERDWTPTETKTQQVSQLEKVSTVICYYVMLRLKENNR